MFVEEVDGKLGLVIHKIEICYLRIAYRAWLSVDDAISYLQQSIIVFIFIIVRSRG